MSVTSLLAFLLLVSRSSWSNCDPLPGKKIINVAEAPVGKPIAIQEQVAQLPTHFDARQRWPECASTLERVSSQGSCGSCWAFVTTAVAADRLCIASKGAITVHFSPWQLLQCCGLGDCADGILDFGGCAGGDPWGTWRFMATQGIVTDACQPYPNWVQRFGVQPFKAEDNVTCETHCKDGSLSYRESLHFVHSYYRLPMNEATIRHDIATNGPVVVGLFYNEHLLGLDGSTLYRCADTRIPNHGVKLIGWGELENGDKYWLAVNSWGRDWADNGTFRIARGENTCHVEEVASSVIFN